MRIGLNVPEYSIKKETTFYNDIFNEQRKFPVLNIGRDSYIEQAFAEVVIDNNMIYNLQIGRYSSVAHDVTFIVDMNHDYRRPCQGRISGYEFKRPDRIKRKGQIVIMNDCWVGEKTTIMSGVIVGNGAVVAAEAVVTKDVPPYAIVAGNPAQIIGYRFSKEQIEKLLLIRWWNWSQDKVRDAYEDLCGDIDEFIHKYLDSAVGDIMDIVPVTINPIEKNNQGEERRYLYIPDFEQEYPTYPRVIGAFADAFNNTNVELLLYIQEDDALYENLATIDKIFEEYHDVNCYVNVFVGDLQDKRDLFAQVDGYITNRSLDNVYNMDMASMYNLPIISGVDSPIFGEIYVERMVTEINKLSASTSVDIKDMVKTLTEAVKKQNCVSEQLANQINILESRIQQLSVNQFAMNNSIDNLKYEILASCDKPNYPIVKSGEDAVWQIINNKASMCRFGDGEFAVIAGVNRQKFQRADDRLAERLKEVLASNQEDVLVCVADTYGDLSKYNLDCKYNIRAYMTEEVRKQHYELLDFNKVYYDTYVTRPYASYVDNNTDAPKRRFNNLKQIWQDKKLLIIEGEKTRMGIGNDLFDNALDIVRILGPAENAFDRYDDILKETLKQDRERLVLIAMGATATVLAYDLAKVGFQALDIGHIDMEYEWMLAGTGKKTEVKYKYNNEVAGGDKVEEINDPIYESQIIAKIV